jgi:uncharacterized protein
MMIVDANLLLYAYNADAPQQRSAAQWLANLLARGETIGLLWITLWASIRIATTTSVTSGTAALCLLTSFSRISA